MDSSHRLGVVAVVLTVVVTAGTAVAFTPTGPAQTVPTTDADALAQHSNTLQHHQRQSFTLAQTGEPNQTGNLSVTEIVQNALESYEDIHNFNATLVSITNVSNEMNVSNGTGAIGNITVKAKLSFEKPDNIRFKYLSSERIAGSVIISNGTSVIFYHPENNTYRVFSFNFSGIGGTRAINLTQTGYLDSIARTLTQSNVTYLGTATVSGQETYVLSVKPTGIGTNFIDNRTFYLSQETYLPVKRVIHASLSIGNQTTGFTTTTILREVHVNVSIPKKVFEFTPPEGAELVKGPLSNISPSSYNTLEQVRQNTTIPVCQPSQIPAGYSFANATVSSVGNTTTVRLRYTNDSPGTTALTISISELGATQRSNGTAFGQTVSIDSQSGTFIEIGGQGIVSYTADGLQYSVSGPFSKQKLVSIVASIDCAAGGDDAPAADDEDGAKDDGAAQVCEAGSPAEVVGENDEDDDGDGAIDEDDEDPNDGASNDDDDGDGAVDEDDECDDGDDGSDDFTDAEAEDDDDGDGAVDEDDEPDSGNSDDVDNDGDGAVDEDDEPDTAD